MVNVEQQIRIKANELGFSHIGITSPNNVQHYDVYEEWLSKMYHGQMDYLAKPYSRIKRKNPTSLLKGCKSLIVVGLLNQHITPITTTSTNKYGRIASFATGQDYHIRLTERLIMLRNYLSDDLNLHFNSKICVDSSPVLEKGLAQQAGLGWIGKNSLLISPTTGSYFNIGELLLDIDFNFSTEFSSDLCKECQLCIDACPTGCINTNKTINASQCISYLTIEHKGNIEKPLRRKMGEWVFGCDICQQVCPYNIDFLKTFNDITCDQIGFLDLNKEISLTESEFSSKYRTSPIKRIGFISYLRNLIIAIGNFSLSDSTPILGDFLTTSQYPLLRIMSAWALGRISNQSSRNILENAIKNEKNPEVREEILFSLSDMKI